MPYNTGVGNNYNTGGSGYNTNVYNPAGGGTTNTAEMERANNVMAAMQNFQQMWQSGNKQSVYEQSQGTNKDIAAVATQVINENTPKDIDTAGRAMFGDKWTPQMFTEALNKFSKSGSYQWQELDKFLGDYSANPSFVGQATAMGFAKHISDKIGEEKAAAIAPGSLLDKAYFGEGGIIPAEFEAFKTSMQPSQEEAYQRLSDTLSARGLGTSGALQAGQEKIGGDYAQVLKEALLGMTSQGKQNILSQAKEGTDWTRQEMGTGMQDVASSIQQRKTDEQAKAYQNAINKASGWSWLTPAASLVGTLAGQPWIGPALGLGQAATGVGTDKQGDIAATIKRLQEEEQNKKGYTMGSY